MSVKANINTIEDMNENIHYHVTVTNDGEMISINCVNKDHADRLIDALKEASNVTITKQEDY